MVQFLFVGYTTGRVDLIDVENHQVTHTLELKSDVECLNWTQNNKESYDDLDELQGNTKLVNISLSSASAHLASLIISLFPIWYFIYSSSVMATKSICHRCRISAH